MSLRANEIREQLLTAGIKEQMIFSFGMTACKNLIANPSIKERLGKGRQIDLKEIQNLELEILKRFRDFCNKNDLTYYLAYGTLLGAIRHKGFVPWDDDVDVFMPYEDYKKMLGLWPQEGRYILGEWRKDNNYLWNFAKIMDCNTCLLHTGYPMQACMGLYIDIFPLTGCAEGESGENFLEKNMKMNKDWECFYSVNTLLGCEEPDIREGIIKHRYCSDFKKAKIVGDGIFSWYVRREVFDDVVEVEFEGELFAAPKGYDEFLKVKYGNYMEMPPESKRWAHMFETYYLGEPINEANGCNRDVAYWNSYYKKHKCDQPSLFAKSILKLLNKGADLLELGCGNGRDSLYFAHNGINVTAIDVSEQAISLLKRKREANTDFIHGDFVCLTKEYMEEFDYCYSRFTMHAIDKEQECQVIKAIYGALRKDGRLFIEVRSVNDEIYGKGIEVGRDSYVFDEHFRRFIRKNELEDELKINGFIIEYSEENRGFAPFKGEDPLIIRIIAKK